MILCRTVEPIGGTCKIPGSQGQEGWYETEAWNGRSGDDVPTAKNKSHLVEASRDTNVSLSSFMVLAALKEAAALQGRQITDLLPADELQCYRACRVDQKHRAAAKRAWTTIRAKQNERQIGLIEE